MNDPSRPLTGTPRELFAETLDPEGDQAHCCSIVIHNAALCVN